MTPTVSTAVVDLPGGPVAIRDTGGDGPLVVFVHGVLVDGRVWDPLWPAVAAAGYRCVLPDLPIGAHRRPLEPGADRSPLGQARRVAALVRALGAERAVIIGNDSGGAISQILTADDPDVVDRLVLATADAFEHFPPMLFKPLPLLARSPRVLGAAIWPITRRPAFRAPGGLGWLTKRPMPAELMQDWFRALYADPAVMRDMAGFIAPMAPKLTIDAAERLRTFPRPALMAWAREDRFFPYSDGVKLAAMMPQGRVVPIDDAYTFVMWDQPSATADAVVDFLRETEGENR